MAGNEPFKSTTYQVGRIAKAFSSDIDGNLIFEDIPNPEGVTLTQLLEGKDSNNITFDALGTFFSNVENVADALKYLNMFAYLKDTGRFLLVDPTITAEKVVEGEIYTKIEDAINWIDNQVNNGYNCFNILLMGSHKQQGTLEQESNLGVYEIDGSTSFSPIVMKRNGIKIIGIGDPVIRIKNFTGTSEVRRWIFQIDSDGTENKINVSIQGVGFEIVDSVYTSIFWIKDAPLNNATKERNGFKASNVSISFNGGTNAKNRLLDVLNPTSTLPSFISLDDIKIGSIVNTEASSQDIELVYVNHNEKTVVSLSKMMFGLTEQPNPLENSDSTKTTSFTGIVVYKGNVVVDTVQLDEKFYWNGSIFSDVITKLLKAHDYSHVAMSNVGIIRNSYNTINESAGGITTIKDWIVVDSTASVNIDGFDSYLNVDVVSLSTSGTSGTPTSGTSGTSGTPGTTGTSGTLGDIKPVKSFFSKDKLAFGIGHLGEVRIGKLKSADLNPFVSYSLNYGIPLWYNEDTKQFQYWNGTNILALGSSVGASGKTSITNITAPMFSATSYNFSGEATYLGFEVLIAHNLVLSNKNAYNISVVDTVTGRKIEPQEVVSVDINTIKLIMGEAINVTVTIIGF
jgi:hypothetical protein